VQSPEQMPPPAGRGRADHPDAEVTMTELAHTEVQRSGKPDASEPRKPFVAPAVEQLGTLETSTLVTGEP
jgi:hypothetical protein